RNFLTICTGAKYGKEVGAIDGDAITQRQRLFHQNFPACLDGPVPQDVLLQAWGELAKCKQGTHPRRYFRRFTHHPPRKHCSREISVGSRQPGRWTVSAPLAASTPAFRTIRCRPLVCLGREFPREAKGPRCRR